MSHPSAMPSQSHLPELVSDSSEWDHDFGKDGDIQVGVHRKSISGNWVDDTSALICSHCTKAFSTFIRRHHCRICGLIFCAACSRTRIFLPINLQTVNAKKLRVCDICATTTFLQNTSDFTTFAQHRTPQSNPTSVSCEPHDFITNTQRHPLLIPVIMVTAHFLVLYFVLDEVSTQNPAFSILILIIAQNIADLTRNLYLHTGNTSTPLQHAYRRMTQDSNADTDTTKESDVNEGYDFRSMSPSQRSDLLLIGSQTVDTLWDLCRLESDWQSESSIHDDVTICSLVYENRRIYKCTAKFGISANMLFDELYTEFEQSTTWNVTAAQIRVLTVLDQNTDIVSITSAPALKGMVSSRDFVNVRVWTRRQKSYVIACRSAADELLLPVKGIVRGDNGPGGFIISAESGASSRLEWILSVDLKGYFPSSVYKKGCLSEIDCFVRNLRRHIKKKATL